MRKHYLLSSQSQVIFAYKGKKLNNIDYSKAKRPPDIKCRSIDLKEVCKLSRRFQSIIF